MSFYSKTWNNICDFISKFKLIVIFYLSWIFIHYTSSQLYIYYCSPNTHYGIYFAPFLSLPEQCIVFRCVIDETNNAIYGMWIAGCSWLMVSKILYPYILSWYHNIPICNGKKTSKRISNSISNIVCPQLLIDTTLNIVIPELHRILE